MLPRPILKDNFSLTYRKIPVLAIGREIYIDTSLILEALEHSFPPSQGYGSLYPGDLATTYRPLIRGFASYWTDRPLFRVTTGLIPASVWRTHFGTDRANLIGHQLDAEKLERKVPQNLSGLDLQLSLLEPLFTTSTTAGSGSGSGKKKKWIFDDDGEGESGPSAADIALWYQLDWGEKISRGQGIENLTGGGTPDGDGEGLGSVLNEERYPGLVGWFERVKSYFEGLPDTETRIEKEDEGAIAEMMDRLKTAAPPSVSSIEDKYERVPLIPTPAGPHTSLDGRNGLVPGAAVSVAPDDTGRDSPTIGTLLAITPEEVVLEPGRIGDGNGPKAGPVRVHFPRVGFVVRPLATPRGKTARL
ncbi:hypothetical protein LTR99_007454 [Exophiala xenobiotica]|uniref:GST N-terminal domain-containing protein n=1 Tax=Vermiconidia calcicola TaxID=1690605 RepID=A0AAV9Q5W1_9PEZI|nr:hypothetical protein LTR92_002542 [Exophiala xenobiotica]KAK5534563.1 hypothetical protein LTR25_006595 [Vermiconidia calcicola]KAK5544556.1 hypothetical protein LTR23_004320 [Chaetothyriales sp. CCFEE 6169]KAK5266841.1 hypothetical protein LTR96_008091 [Exophiala xenobiotica]KAK5299186.1 hypothetical protein LTR99_007454 [Exophiala xenobiotica]